MPSDSTRPCTPPEEQCPKADLSPGALLETFHRFEAEYLSLRGGDIADVAHDDPAFQSTLDDPTFSGLPDDLSFLSMPEELAFQATLDNMSRGLLGYSTFQSNFALDGGTTLTPTADAPAAATGAHMRIENPQRAQSIRQISDSGYASLGLVHGFKTVVDRTGDDPAPIQDDTITVYSSAMSIADVRVESYVSDMVEELLKSLDLNKLSADVVEALASALPGLLRGLALRIGHDAPSQRHRDIMVFLHRYRE